MGIQIIQDSEEFESRIDSKLDRMRNAIITELKNEFKPKIPEEFLTRNEVAQLLKVNVNTVDRWSKEGQLRRYGLGNKIFFKRSEVEESIQKIK